MPAQGQIISPTTSQIVTNGSQTQITGGVAVDTNLFHEFSLFDVNAGTTATFIVPASVENVLGRVTGGQSSSIEGQLAVTNSANLWLINPAGIVFGPDASLNLQGDFNAATADAVGFEMGWFAENSDYALLTGLLTALGLRLSRPI
ncbi:MAG: filamentous hemagglutinin N-terminal domain-containing protein [Moorea sp. SIO3C2]|nr:filamentous hemagglutinin N-terminal domain-containing protein [Moorena sp. SIO3C2]